MFIHRRHITFIHKICDISAKLRRQCMLIYHFTATFYIHSATADISIKAYISYSLLNIHNGSACIDIHQMSVFLCLMYCIHRTVWYYICLVIGYKCAVQIKKYYHKNHSNKYIIYAAKRFFKSDILNLYRKHCRTYNSRIVEKLSHNNLFLLCRNICSAKVYSYIIHYFAIPTVIISYVFASILK